MLYVTVAHADTGLESSEVGRDGVEFYVAWWGCPHVTFYRVATHLKNPVKSLGIGKGGESMKMCLAPRCNCNQFNEKYFSTLRM